MLNPVSIQSSRGPYTVHFHEDIREVIGRLSSESNRLFVVDSKVAAAFESDLAPLSNLAMVTVEATEDEKTLGGCEKILSALVASNANRSTTIVAIGGGIVQDLVTLCAHLYFRGVDWIYLPTTLLAMADSCVGAKASINFKGYKNQLGVFHSPKEIHICTQFLETLPEDQLRSGYGEAFKLHFAASPRRFFAISDLIGTEGWRTKSVSSIVRDSIQIKKGYIETDEFDQGIRRHLNYGHTFGHALESVTDHGVPHGLAICWGMDLINYLAFAKGRIEWDFFEQIHSRLLRFFSWSLDTPFSAEALVAATRRDKKVSDGKLSLIMPDREGSLSVVKQDFDEELMQGIHTYLSTHSIITPLKRTPQ